MLTPIDREGRTPDEVERMRLKQRLEQLKSALLDPNWAVMVEHFQETARAILERVLYCKSEELELYRASLRAHIEAVKDFGIQDLLVEGRILELDKMIKATRRDVREQIRAAYAGGDEDAG